MTTSIRHHDLRGLAIGSARLCELHGLHKQLGVSVLELHPPAAASARKAVREPLLKATTPALQKMDELNKELADARQSLKRVQGELDELEGKTWLRNLGNIRERAERKVTKRFEAENLRELITNLETTRQRLEPEARKDLETAAEKLGEKLGADLRKRQEQWQARWLDSLRENLAEIFGLVEEGRAIGREMERAMEDRLKGVSP
jgi:hypothetical protein